MDQNRLLLGHFIDQAQGSRWENVKRKVLKVYLINGVQ